jgi:predicted glutamine amidotransferase
MSVLRASLLATDLTLRATVINMCRLFGLHAGDRAVAATFWLLGAPDSLLLQSHRNPDGAGIGAFGPDGSVTVDKQPIAAWEDPDFARAARDLRATTFVAHVRYASTGAHVLANTHPFLQDGRLFAHNGVVLGLDRLDARLATLDATAPAHGDTDSERLFALITAETRRNNGDIGAGLVAAISWVAEQVPVYAVNLVLTTATDLWALRYPETHELYVLERPAGGTASTRDLHASSDRISAHSPELAETASVLVATERMDDDPAWRLLQAGELLHVKADLSIETSIAFPDEPRQLLRLADLDPVAAASQHPDAHPASGGV